MALSNVTLRSGTVDKTDPEAERRFKRRLLPEHARYSNRAIEVTLNEESKRVLRDLINYFGMPWLSKKVRLHEQTILKVLAGFQDRLRPDSAQKLKDFLVGYDR